MGDLVECQWCNGQVQFVVFFCQVDKGGLVGDFGWYVGIECMVEVGYGNQFGFQVGGENVCGFVVVGFGQGMIVQWCINMDVVVGNDFGVGVDYGGDDQVVVVGIEVLIGV